MKQIAQTNLQLYNQLRLDGRSPDELTLIRKCYELGVTLYTGSFQCDGKPFTAHTVGVASIMAQLGASSVIVGAACVHNIYGNGNFGDGLRESITPERKRFVIDAVGEEVEAAIDRFRSFRLNRNNVGEISSRLDSLSARDKELVTMDLADHLEKYVDYGVLYFGSNAWVTDFIDEHGETLIDLAERLGHHDLAVALADAFRDTARQTIPPELKRDPKHADIELVVPLSCVARPAIDDQAISR